VPHLLSRLTYLLPTLHPLGQMAGLALLILSGCGVAENKGDASIKMVVVPSPYGGKEKKQWNVAEGVALTDEPLPVPKKPRSSARVPVSPVKALPRGSSRLRNAGKRKSGGG